MIRPTDWYRAAALLCTVGFAANFALSSPRAAYADPPSRSVSGTVSLEGAVDLRQPVNFEFYPATGGSAFVRSVTLDAAGNYSLTSIPSGSYHFSLKGYKWLRTTHGSLDLTGGNVTGLSDTLPAGDANDDNLCNAGDFGLLVNSYGSDVSDPGSGYDIRADFTCDGLVDLADFGLLSNNLDTGGSAYEIALTATPGSGQISLTWPAVPNATGYNLYRSHTPAHGSIPYRSNLTSLQFTDRGLPAGIYYYQVVAIGTCALSNETPPVSPTIPTVPSFPIEPGLPYSWQAMVSNVNTVSGNKITTLPIVSWTARGGLPVGLTLVHNSQGQENGPLGPRWTHSLDLTGTADGAGNVTLHSGDGRLTTYHALSGGAFQPPTGVYSTLTKNGNGSYTLLTKTQIIYQYNANLRCQSITDTNGNTITFSYNGAILDHVTDPTGRILQLAYTGGSLTGVTDPLSRHWTLTYNGGKLASVIEPMLAGDSTVYSTAYLYDSNSEIRDIKTPRGTHWTFNVNGSGQQVWQQDPAGNRTTFDYSAVVSAGGATLPATIVTDANGNAAIYAYDGERLTLSEDSQGYQTQTLYDATNNVTQITDRRGKIWRFPQYDGQGNVLRTEDPYGHPTLYTYTPHNRLHTVTDANTHTTTLTYDAHDNLHIVTNGRLHDTTFEVNSFGLVWKRTDGNNHVTQYEYDTNGHLNKVTDANQHPTAYQPNVLGWTLSSTDANSHTTSYQYDTWGRLILETEPQDINTDISQTGNTYDANDNLVRVRDSNLHDTLYQYDAADRLTKETRANNDTITYGYDGFGQKGLLSWKQDGNGLYTTYGYTLRDEVSGMGYANGTSEAWTYDPAGNLASHTDANGKYLTYDYYDHDLLQHINYPHDPQVIFTYDDAGLQKTMWDATGQTAYTYDEADNLTQITSPGGTVSYQYDNAELRSVMTLAGTGDYFYTYDPADNLYQVKNPFNETTTYQYDAADRLKKQTNANGTTETTTYDAQDRVTSVTSQTATLDLLAKQEYTYDAAGNVLTRTETNPGTPTPTHPLGIYTTHTTYTYDGADQLLTEDALDSPGGQGVVGNRRTYDRAYAYDHAGNRTSGPDGLYTYYPNSNRLQSAGNRTYTYDAAGNVKTLAVNGTIVQRFDYDDEERVSAIAYPSAPTLPTSTFGYNGLRLRTSRQDSTGLSRYVTDGDSPASDALSDGRTVYTPGLSERRNGTTASRFQHQDALGGVIAFSSASQALGDVQATDAFGQFVYASGPAFVFGFEGDAQYQADGDSGLLLVGNRYYDPAIGRYLQPDPSGEEDNEYVYAANNPLSNNDPDGLKQQSSKGSGCGPQKKKGSHKGSRGGKGGKGPNGGSGNKGGKGPNGGTGNKGGNGSKGGSHPGRNGGNGGNGGNSQGGNGGGIHITAYPGSTVTISGGTLNGGNGGNSGNGGNGGNGGSGGNDNGQVERLYDPLDPHLPGSGIPGLPDIIDLLPLIIPLFL